MINKESVLMCVLTLLVVGYLSFFLPVTTQMAAADTLTGMKVEIHDPEGTHFITMADIVRESGIDPDTVPQCKRSTFDIYGLEQRLRASDKIQDVNVTLLSSGRVCVDVVPMRPVARVFNDGKSYYINAGGKKITAEPRYHLDVPVVVGYFDSIRPAERLLPLLDYIAADPGLSALVSTVVQERKGDIIIVPVIVGHVVNFGDTTDVADKFSRLLSFYRRVAPYKGWETYDTIAVKWRGQIVATKRHKRLNAVALPTELDETGIFDIDDDETMTDPLTVAEGIDEG